MDRDAPPPSEHAGRRDGDTSCLHLVLEPVNAHRRPERPDEVIMRGMIMFDTGGFKAIEAVVPMPVFMQIQALALLAQALHLANPIPDAPIEATGNAWVVEGSRSAAGDAAPDVVLVRRVIALDRLLIEPTGPRFIASLPVSRVVPRLIAPAT